VGDDGGGGGVGGRPVVGVIDVGRPGLAPGGVGGDDNVGLAAPDPARDLAAQVEGRLQRAVVVAEEEDVLDPQLHGGGALLRVADLGQPLAGHGRIAAAPVAVGQDQVGHVAPF